MKTKGEIKQLFQKITCNGSREMTEERFIQAINEYASQFNSPLTISDEEIEKEFPERSFNGTYLETNMGRRESAKWMRDKALSLTSKEKEVKHKCYRPHLHDNDIKKYGYCLGCDSNKII